ncbi:chemotaxis protein CheA [Fusibacter paucivorans]|uniref:Chemotaxis protein CheA n=1 Tax=Fusibacter paucivorans TaxID=76009 RepID=A0ABS5PTM9_9FIRM|nr:chemotaxis protein CheA [Fusibacter paucivorans]MBS7527706.1 chemotaxis protein CheA [Fusibacter paucivorans]
MSDFNTNEPMIEMYIYETVQLIDRLEQLVMETEETASLAFAIDEIFRIMHTIKGNSMMMLYENIAVVAHRLEDLFDLLRKDESVVYDVGKITDLTLEMIDFVKAEIQKLERGITPNGNSDELKQTIVAYMNSLTFMNDQPDIKLEDTVDTNDQRYYLSPTKTEAKAENSVSAETDIQCYKASVHYEAGSGMENIRAFTFIHTVKEKWIEYHHYPKDVTNDPDAGTVILEKGFHIIFKTKLNETEVTALFDAISFLDHYILNPIDEQQYIDYLEAYQIDNVNTFISEPKVEKSAEEELEAAEDEMIPPAFETTETMPKSEDAAIEHIKKALNPKSKTDTSTKEVSVPAQTKAAMISVDVHRVDKLMDLVGELVVSEAMVTQNPEIQKLQLESFEKAARQFRIIMNDLQDTVMSMRMVPLALTFQKMNRIVRDMKKKIGKDVELVIIGEQTEVDKNVIENINDPLMHIIRNSVDHGIETIEERVDAGKNEKGTITLEAKHSGGDVWIIVKDDGRGLDREKILDKCEDRGILTKSREDYSDREVYEMLFAPGFSTKEQVTEFSGRGVGLDVVAKNIKKIGGSVIISSELGMGSEFAIKIPLTLAIINSMMMQVGKTIFSVPIVSIRSSFIANERDITTDPDGHEMVIVRGQAYPIIRLHKRYNLETEVKALSDGILMMIEENGRTRVFFADAILGEQQLVVKSPPHYLKHVEGLTGFALLGDGRISIILDPDQLVS